MLQSIKNKDSFLVIEEQLLSKDKQRVVVSFIYSKNKFVMNCSNPAVQESFFKKGIPIPKERQSSGIFANKKIIHIEDHILFPIAFFLFIVPKRFPSESYEHRIYLKNN